jgi:protocatechuate 3,4-dioxygenase beta subunit
MGEIGHDAKNVRQQDKVPARQAQRKQRAWAAALRRPGRDGYLLLPKPKFRLRFAADRADAAASLQRSVARPRSLSMREILTQDRLPRRHLLLGATAATLLAAPSRFALAALAPTPRQTPGPFYPQTLPLDSDNDLVRVTGHARDAAGTIAHVSGRILDVSGQPISDAKVEIWQCDSHGRYHYVDDRNPAPLDPDFQGYGTTVSARDGGYRFRTIRPVPYPGRTPHIHFTVTAPRGGRLVTQMYVAGEPLNERDPVLAQIRDSAARAAVIVALAPAPQVEPGALAGSFDIVLG